MPPFSVISPVAKTLPATSVPPPSKSPKRSKFDAVSVTSASSPVASRPVSPRLSPALIPPTTMMLTASTVIAEFASPLMITPAAAITRLACNVALNAPPASIVAPDVALPTNMSSPVTVIDPTSTADPSMLSAVPKSSTRSPAAVILELSVMPPIEVRRISGVASAATKLLRTSPSIRSETPLISSWPAA